MRTIIACSLAMLLLANIGCSVNRDTTPVPHDPPKVSQPADTQAKPPRKNPDEYKDKKPQARVPDDVTNPGQRIIAVFNDGSDICLLNGQQTVMEGKAVVKKYWVLLPRKTLAAVISIPENAAPFDPEGKTGFIEDKSIVYINPTWWIKDIGYDTLKDHHIGRFEILESFPLSEDDLIIGDISLTMTVGEIRRLLGPPRLDELVDLYYQDHVISGRAVNKNPYLIMTRSARFATCRGIRVGDSLDKVLALYGRGYHRGYGYAQPDIFEYHFPKRIGKIELAFEVDENNCVKEIVLNNFGEGGMFYSTTR